MRLAWLACGAVLVGAAGCVSTELSKRPVDYDYPAPHADPLLDRITWDRLDTFDSEAEFARYLDTVREEARARGYWWADTAPQYVVETSSPLPSPSTPSAASAASDGVFAFAPATTAAAETAQDQVVVTGSRLPGETITNVQELGVDEGDLVKRIGQYLVVLQDGRLFSIDTRPDGAPGLRLAARQNVYRASDEDTWYDEILTFGRRVLVTGYSYAEEATEFSVFTLEDDGRFTREAVFYMTSNDYYDVDNYATRIVGDQLVIHTPLRLTAVHYDYYGAGHVAPPPWPAVRRWRAEAEGGARPADTHALFDATDIHRPLQRTLQPTIHTVSVCPLGDVDDGAALECRATAVTGPEAAVFYVTPEYAWLWLAPTDDEWFGPDQHGPHCVDDPALGFADAAPAAIYRIALPDGAIAVAGARGIVDDQFALDYSDGVLRALAVQWPVNECSEYEAAQELRLLRAPDRRFGTTLRALPQGAYTPLPLLERARTLDHRFTNAHLVYAESDWTWYYGDHSQDIGSRVVTVPLSRPRAPTILEAPHSIIRLESLGDRAVLTGYGQDVGLAVSLLDLGATPAIADTLVLQNRSESEGRSHAFNATLAADGSGVLGLPTVIEQQNDDRVWWRSDASDVSFIEMAADGSLASLGPLSMSAQSEHPDYVCEVSCVDWYGNSRPIFTDGRVFALSGAELIEGEIRNGRMVELRRVNITAPLGQDAADQD